MNSIVLAPTLFLASMVQNKPVAMGIAVAALVVLYLAFKVAKFAIKMLLLIVAVTAIGFAVRWFFAAQNGAF